MIGLNVDMSVNISNITNFCSPTVALQASSIHWGDPTIISRYRVSVGFHDGNFLKIALLYLDLLLLELK